MKKKLVSAMLVLSMCSSLVACGNSGANDDVVGTEAGTESASATDGSGESEISMPDGYDATSSSIYNEQLGDFYTAYQTALEAEDLDERFALEAIAEAKLMESAVMVPTTTKGGAYAISRYVPYTSPNVLWGNDYERYHNRLSVEGDLIKATDIEAMKAKYIPNILSSFRIVLVAVFAWVFLATYPDGILASVGIFMLSGLTDVVDGALARHFGWVSRVGKVLDPIADKVLVLAGLIVLIADPYETNVFGRIGIIGIIYGGVGVSIIMAREMVVSSLRMMAAKKGIVLAAEMTGKVKTFFTDVTIIVLLLAGDLLNFAPNVGVVFDCIGLVCFGISVLLTIISGCSYLIKNKEVFNG